MKSEELRNDEAISRNSKNIVAVGYNPFSMILRIQLKNGMYDFFNVPESIYTGLLHAQSKSYYHNTYIKILSATQKSKLNTH